jgi:hypothetical protein
MFQYRAVGGSEKRNPTFAGRHLPPRALYRISEFPNFT